MRMKTRDLQVAAALLLQGFMHANGSDLETFALGMQAVRQELNDLERFLDGNPRLLKMAQASRAMAVAG